MTTAMIEIPSRFGGLILCWLLTRAGEEGTRGNLNRAFESLLGPRGSAAEGRPTVEESLAALHRAGQVERAKPPKRTALVLTDRGKRAILKELDLKSLPKGSDWGDVKKRYLVARALELQPTVTQAGGKPPGGAGPTSLGNLARHHELGLGDSPTLDQVRDALAWRALGIKDGGPFTETAVLKLLSSRTLGAAMSLEPGEVLQQPVVKGGGALDPGWPEDDDRAFAARVLAAARASKTGRFGDHKVFIAHVFRQLGATGAAGADLDAFKARLVSAHRSGLLSLSRADLVEAMAPEDVDASEARYLSATFHFVGI